MIDLDGSEWQTDSSEETYQAGKAFGNLLFPTAVVALEGDLGAGKTTFVRGLVEGVLQEPPINFASPTFSLLNIYTSQLLKSEKSVFHFDLYRLPRHEEFIAAGFEEYLHTKEICCIEWAEKIAPLIPKEAFYVHFAYLGEEKRKISIFRKCYGKKNSF